MKNRAFHIIFDLILVITFFIVMTWLIYRIHGWGTDEFAYTCLVGIMGLTLGLLIGVFISPFSTEEKKEFSKLQTTILGFVTGFLASKVEPILSYLIKDFKVITDPKIGSRALIFIICLLYSIVYVYVYRKYYIEENLGNASTNIVNSKDKTKS